MLSRMMPALALERTVLGGGIDRQTAARTWHGAGDDVRHAGGTAGRAQLTILRNAPHDFRDRQVYVWVDGESWGKIKYDVPMTAEITAGPHTIRVNNTLFNDRLTFVATAGEHVRVRCANGMPLGGWLMLLLLHATYLRVRLEREL
jgi:hypothetical protein